MVSVVAFIPARAGSKRIPDKNIKLLGGKPLMAYTIEAALDSNIFEDVIVSTDSTKYADIAIDYGAEVVMRPLELATDLSHDIEWVKYTLRQLRYDGRFHDCFSILRPTSPFRTAGTIRRAWKEFLSEDVDSLRAVELCRQHPYKMWKVDGKRMTPYSYTRQHSQPYQTLPDVYIQNASLEIAKIGIIFNMHTIAGNIIMPFFTKGYEGFDINRLEDWEKAEELLCSGKAKLDTPQGEG